MKLYLTLAIIFSCLEVYAVDEQCLVKNLPSRLDINTVTSITLKTNAVVLNGYRLDCEDTGPDWCKKKAKVNKAKTEYKFEGNVLTLKRDAKGKLTGSGKFVSDKYTDKGSVSLKCIIPKPVIH